MLMLKPFKKQKCLVVTSTGQERLRNTSQGADKSSWEGSGGRMDPAKTHDSLGVVGKDYIQIRGSFIFNVQVPSRYLRISVFFFCGTVCQKNMP